MYLSLICSGRYVFICSLMFTCSLFFPGPFHAAFCVMTLLWYISYLSKTVKRKRDERGFSQFAYLTLDLFDLFVPTR